MRGNVHVLASFRDAQVRAAIHLAKFHRHAHAIKLLSALCIAYLKTLPEKEYIVVPIPLSPRRLRERGHNQAATIAKAALAPFPRMQLLDNALCRTRHTPPQTSLARAQRLTNLSHAFAVNDKYLTQLRNAHIIIFDDVTTTGATCITAVNALFEAQPASITCIAIAH